MSFRVRLTVVYAAILTGFFCCFALLSYFVARQTLLSALDSSLENTTLRVVNSTGVFRTGDITLLRFPDDMGLFQTATTFMMAVDNQGEVLAKSSNLANFEGTLDDRSRTGTEPAYSSVSHYGQRLRVFTYPLILEKENGDPQLIGHLQVAQLMDAYYGSLNQLGSILIAIGGAVFVFFLLLGARTTHSLLRPLADITGVALQITRADDLSRRLPDHGRDDEIGKLTMALNQTFERLENLFRAQRRLLADVSHELRTPLTTVRGNIDLMRRMGETDPESLDIIQDELERMTRLVGDLLLLARADSGSMPLRAETVELDTVLLDVFRQVQSLSDQQGVKVILQEVQPARLMADSDKIKQLMLILVDNAIKYSGDNGTVTLSLVRQEDNAIITVSDTGMGIPPEHLPHIFDRFYRVDKARSRAQGGSGLGLSIAKWVTQAHNGQINVQSNSRQGTKFTVSLPALPEAVLRDELPKPERRITQGRRITLPSLRGNNSNGNNS